MALQMDLERGDEVLFTKTKPSKNCKSNIECLKIDKRKKLNNFLVFLYSLYISHVL